MAKSFDRIDGDNAEFLLAQRVFFVATAPLSGGGHVNLSPKGLDSLRVLDPQTVAYLDYTGSGAETIAHVRENGRIVLMACAFDGPPNILRVHGRGEIVAAGAQAFDALRARFGPGDGVRAVVVVHVERVSTSCGYGVPLMRFEGERTQLADWVAKKGADGIAAYQEKNNQTSLDGLPALTRR